jgi:hypothetical protein
MKLLEDIPSFPRPAREVLEARYGIETAEAFYDHGVHNPEGLRAALQLPADELDRLVRLVEGHLSPEYVERSRRAPVKHPRGLRTD